MTRQRSFRRGQRSQRIVGSAALIIASLSALSVVIAQPAGAAVRPTVGSWCAAHGSEVEGWTGTYPNMPLCGPGPDYGGTWSYVVLPGPSGVVSGYFNATPGFQCVELAERYLAVVDGIAPLHANGASVAATYAAADPGGVLVVNGSLHARGNPPRRGAVISFSTGATFSSFSGDGHVAIVVSSHVDRAGNGTVRIAEENVDPSAMVRTLDLVSWRLEDPTEPSNSEFQFPSAEWLNVVPLHALVGGLPRSVASGRLGELALARALGVAARRSQFVARRAFALSL